MVYRTGSRLGQMVRSGISGAERSDLFTVNEVLNFKYNYFVNCTYIVVTMSTLQLRYLSAITPKATLCGSPNPFQNN
jgi:hypothetical protein